ncbi:24.1 kDa heat shock protein, mitochondrial-like [Cornus florida]|uniref:24.1 kDa heat shock protein, mitochondrial-like n=1 Tax=Cornus florida TaxID=4283 RepID=UPI0028989B47|nr:24.1 kDa heat shock protein, mitochondrial-like [Cornus florida]
MASSSSRPLTSTYSLMKLLSPLNASPVLVRSFRPNASAKVCPLVNPFLKEDKEVLYARIDMPGIRRKGLKLWVEDNSLHVTGVEEVDDDGPGPRKFSGAINLSQGSYKVDKITAELKRGMLKIKVPKIKLEDRKDIILVNVE